MSEYIKRDDALNIDFKIIVRAFENRKTTATNAVQAYADAIARIPSEDVRPVVRGKWIKQEDDACFCSVCQLGLSSFIEGIFYNYCPFCGADMMEES